MIVSVEVACWVSSPSFYRSAAAFRSLSANKLLEKCKNEVKRRHAHTLLDHPVYDPIRLQLGSKYAVAAYKSKGKKGICRRYHHGAGSSVV